MVEAFPNIICSFLHFVHLILMNLELGSLIILIILLIRFIKLYINTNERFKYKCTFKCNMVIKSLTITEGAYEALKTLKHGDESFSDIILRLSSDKIGYAAKFFGALKTSDEEVRKWKNRIKERHIEIEKEFSKRAKR